ncbi:MAG: glycoside hydrolase family 140 protein [Chthoniobacteraceae bacterium]
MSPSRLFRLALATLIGPCSTVFAATPQLKVSDNHHFLVTETGAPFFWLGDTAWELFHRLNREDATRYLENRAKLGFTVVQAVAIAELDGHSDPNPYGFLPLTDLDPARPAVKDGPDNDYWDHVDFIVKKANELGITVGFLPTWGRYWHDMIKDGKPLFTPANAEVYGEWVGRRYKDAGLVWILGGDRGFDNDEQKEVMRAMARGLRKGDGGAHLISLHPNGGAGSAGTFHNEPWLDFNMRQNGHDLEYTGRYDRTLEDYYRTPTKPNLDAEPIYEDHPVSFNAKKLGHSIAADVRRPLYWDLFSGAFGHTYGHHSVWQMWTPERGPINSPLMPWSEAIDQPGAAQMQHARHLLESRPFLTRVPDDSVIVETKIPTAMPGAGTRRLVATRDESGSYAMVYAPVGRKFSVRMEKITGPKVKAWWFNPRDGSAAAIGEFENTGEREFTPPNPGEALDWVLVLDDAAKGFPPPGTHALSK